MTKARSDRIHKILMIMCCIIPILIIGTLFFTNIQGTLRGSIISFGAILFCPIMHMVIMPLMNNEKEGLKEGRKTSCHSHK